MGSGAALAAGRDGNADVVIAHAPTNEKLLLSQGHFTMRLPFAYNYFTVVGKKSDPAGVKTATSAAARVQEDRRLGRDAAGRYGRLGLARRQLRARTRRRWSSGRRPV